MRTDSLIQKAALLLDQRSDVDGAIGVLAEAVGVADASGERVASVEARVFLADVLVREGRESSRAAELIRAARAIAADPTIERDLVEPYLQVASELSVMLGIA